VARQLFFAACCKKGKGKATFFAACCKKGKGKATSFCSLLQKKRACFSARSKTH
jgi:hypothetical protein